jgi:hypothetical protein
MNKACPTCGRRLITGDAENRSVGHIRFCTHVCVYRWYEDPQHDRRHRNRDVEIDRRIQTLVGQT